jgi:hypothetical protein
MVTESDFDRAWGMQGHELRAEEVARARRNGNIAIGVLSGLAMVVLIAAVLLAVFWAPSASAVQ